MPYDSTPFKEAGARMLKFSAAYNTFETDSYTVHLENPDEPNLFRDSFPYAEPPRMGFNHRLVPMRTPKDIWITDTSFRDGQQSMPPSRCCTASAVPKA
jgi:hypothetical protein